MSYDFLNSSDIKDKQFEPPEPEFRLKQHSSKLPVSSRLFPEWAVAAFAILKDKYPKLTISSMSELIALSMQDYIKQNYNMVDGQLPPTEDAIDFLLNSGFINPNSKRQFKHIAQANQKVNEYEVEKASSDNLKDQYEYYKNRDPEKAEEIMNKMTKQVTQELAEEPEPEEEKDYSSDKSEQVVDDHQNSGIATPDHLDQVETAGGSEDG